MPALESLGHLLTILEGGEQVPSWSEMLGDGTIGGEEPLRHCQLNEGICKMGFGSGILRSFRGRCMALSGMFEHSGEGKQLPRGTCFTAHQLS